MRKKLYCSECGNEIVRFYHICDGRIFCEENDDKCIKDYLYEKYYRTIYDDEIDPEYDMSKVDED